MNKAKPAVALVILGALSLFLLLINIVVWAHVTTGHEKGVLTLAALSVGQGDALYIESPTGVQVLVDGGPDTAVLYEVAKVMPEFDRSLDVVLETHTDADHIGGLPSVMRRYEVGMFIEPGMYKDTKVDEVLESEVDVQKVPRYIAKAGMVLDLGGGAILEVLYPDHDVSRLAGQFANDGSIVLRLTYGDTCAMLMGDAPTKVEAILVEQYGTGLDCEILKAGHHGSRTSSSDQFVKTVSPEVALLSLGRNNRYHFPHPEPMNIFKKYGVSVARTDLDGTLVYISDGKTFSRNE